MLLALLRERLPGVRFGSWVNDIDYREYPVVNIRRVGGYRSFSGPFGLDHPVVEITVYHDDGLVEAEELYSRVLDELYRIARDQRELDDGSSVAYVRETMGMTQFSSLFQDTWRVQGLIRVGIRHKGRIK